MTTFCSAAIVALAIGAPASAGIISSDDFNRDNSNVVGNDWAEIESGNGDVKIAGNRLRLRDNDGTPDAQASQLALSTTGFENILLSYDWAPIGAPETGDMLFVKYSIGGAFTLVDFHELIVADGIFTSQLDIALSADDKATFQIRFRTDVTEGPDGEKEGAFVDNVLIKGDEIAAPPPSTSIPAPGTLALFGLGLLGLGATHRRKFA